jgi:hypothetical protein
MRAVILDIDGLQPAYLGPYGCEWSPTPALDRWAAAGVVFDYHFADCPVAENRSWRTSRHPLAPRTATADLLADLRASGIRTARIGPQGSENGWDIEVSAERTEDTLALNSVRRAARELFEQLGSAENALLRVEIDALLAPWSPSEDAIADCFADEEIEPWTDALPERIDPDDDTTFSRLQHTYAAAVATLDSALGRLVVDCGKRGWGNEAVWLLTARRGFPLGERGPVGFAAAELHEELVHLPLMVRWPGEQYAGYRISAMTQPMDLAPTLRELFGLPAASDDDPWAGRSLVPLIRDDDEPVRERAVTGLRRDGRTLMGFRTPERYLTLDDRPDGERHLFVKPDDRWEVNDVRPRNLDFAEELEAEFRGLYLDPGR